MQMKRNAGVVVAAMAIGILLVVQLFAPLRAPNELERDYEEPGALHNGVLTHIVGLSADQVPLGTLGDQIARTYAMLQGRSSREVGREDGREGADLKAQKRLQRQALQAQTAARAQQDILEKAQSARAAKIKQLRKRQMQTATRARLQAKLLLQLKRKVAKWMSDAVLHAEAAAADNQLGVVSSSGKHTVIKAYATGMTGETDEEDEADEAPKGVLTGDEWSHRLGTALEKADLMTDAAVLKMNERVRCSLCRENQRKQLLQRKMRTTNTAAANTGDAFAHDGRMDDVDECIIQGDCDADAFALHEDYDAEDAHLPHIHRNEKYNYLPMTRDMAVHIKCDHEENCLKDNLYERFLPPEQQPYGCERGATGPPVPPTSHLSHMNCEIHLVFVACVDQKNHIIHTDATHPDAKHVRECPEYYYANPPAPPPPPEPAPPPDSPKAASPPKVPKAVSPHKVPKAVSPPRVQPWMPTPWVSAQSAQHVHDDDKYLTGVHLGTPKDGHTYSDGQVASAPRGRWAVSLPSDDNKLRRKWYRRTGTSQDTEGPDLKRPDGRGELREGGLGTTLRWRPKYRYAHGYSGQDGPHWLGGYDDIEGPPIVGADALSGKGLPNVNVYSWNMDKQLAHTPNYLTKIHLDKTEPNRGLENFLTDAETIKNDLVADIWPPLVPETESKSAEQLSGSHAPISVSLTGKHSPVPKW